MGRARVMIQIVPEQDFPPETNIIMSEILANKLHLPLHPVWITFGSAADTAFIITIENDTPLIRLSSNLAYRLKITYQKTLNAHYHPASRCLRFGPLLGILMNENVEGSENQKFGAMARFLEECAQACSSRAGSLIVFSPEQISLSKKSVRGWMYENKKWLKSESPLPETIYNRITTRKIEKQPILQKNLAILRNTHKIPIFNESFLDKKQVYQMLIQDKNIKKMLPETISYHSSYLKPMLLRYHTIYLKPTKGSLGQGIIRITQYEGKIVCQYSEKTGAVTQLFNSLKETVRHLSRHVKKSRYIIQQGLNLVTFNGRPVDFRVLVQKNGQGKWSITSTVARIANDQHIVSNLARGGTIRKASQILNEINTTVSKPTLSRIRSSALEIAQSFEKLIDGHFAELGIDLVIDRQGSLWLIELNSKPSKTDDTLTSSSIVTRPSVTRLIDYSLHITEWSPHSKSSNRKTTSHSDTRRKTQ